MLKAPMDSDASAQVPLEALLSEAGWLRGLARSLVSDPAAADDLVQETWLAALQHPPSADRPLRPWLRKVLENFARMRSRGEGARTARERASASSEAQAADADLVDRVEEQRFLAREVLKLEEPFRATLVLRFYEGLSSVEIAKRLGSNDNTVRWRLKRGLELLRERLDRRHGGDRGAWTALLLPLAPTGGEPLVAAKSTATASYASTAAWLGAAALLVVVVALWLRGAVAPVEAPPVAVGAPASADESVVATASQRVERTSASAPDARAAIVARASGRVVDRDGAPLDGVVARLRRGASQGAPSSAAARSAPAPVTALEARTSTSGAFELELNSQDVHAAADEIELSAEGFAPRIVYAPVRPGSDLALGDILLTRTARVRGSVVDAAGRPLANASLQFELLGSRWAADREPPLTEVLNTGLVSWGHTFLSQTGDDGRFERRDLEPSYYRVWAHAPNFEVRCTAPLQVLEGAQLELAPLALDKPAPERTIRGVVYDAAGAPVPGAQVEALRSSLKRDFFRGRAGAVSTWADEHGRFELGAEPGGNYEVAARAGESSALAPWKVGSAGELRLVLTDRPWLELVFPGFDPGGALRVWNADGDDDRSGGVPVESRGGALYVQVDTWRPFELRIQRGEFEALSGTLDPERLPARLVLDLPPPTTLDVFVTAYGAPVRDATVVLLPSSSRTHWRELELQATTDAEGRARVPWGGAPLQRVRVEAKDFARFEATSGWRSSGAQLHLALHRGGVLEGVVRDSDGRAVRGASLLLESTDGARRETASDLEGRYRIAALAPGEWSVQLTAPPALQSSGARAQLEPANRVHDRVAVDDGASARRDYTLAGPPECRLRGRLTLDGVASGPCIAELVRPGKKRVLARAWLAPNGTFELGLDEPGEYELRLDSLLEEGVRSELRQALRLVRGATQFELDERTATLVLQAPPSSPSEFVVRTLVSSGGAWSTLGHFDSQGRARVRLPAGRCQLRIDGGEPVQLDLRAGETREVELPRR
jgi:RNA polymerase sigma-70 factor (ECF subfamily)